MEKKVIGQINSCNVYKVNDFVELTYMVMKEEKENMFIYTSRSNIRKMCVITLVEDKKVNVDEPHCICCESGFRIGWCICSNVGEVPIELQKAIIDGKEIVLHPQNLGCDRNVFFITKK